MNNKEKERKEVARKIMRVVTMQRLSKLLDFIASCFKLDLMFPRKSLMCIQDRKSMNFIGKERNVVKINNKLL